jgi:hypothetical protein
MKNFLLSLSAIGLLWYIGFRYLENNGNINISFSENKEEVTISAKFPKDKTKEVQNYLTKELNGSDDFSFINTELDATITLHNKMNFYIYSNEGTLKIIMDRINNSAESYRKMKKMNEDLKKILTSN